MALVSFPRRLAVLANADPDRVAVTCGDDQISRGELERRAERLARELIDDGVGYGAMVTIALPNSIDWFIAVVACWKVGAIPQPVSSRLPERELASIVELADPPVVLGVPAGTFAGRTCRPDADPRATRPLESGEPGEPGEPLPDATSPAWKAPTSGGSTGRPKLIVAGMSAALEEGEPPVLLLEPDGCLVMPGPLYHNGPIVWSCTAVVYGAHVVVLPRFDAEATLEAIERHGGDVVYLVPTMMKRIWRLPIDVRERYDLSSLRVVWHLAEPCPPWLKDAWIDWLGPERIFELYGGTEAQTATIISGRDWLEHRGSVGRPAEGTVMIADDDGAEVQAGTQGEVWMRSATGATTYRYVGAEARSMEGGWESLGDLGWLDEDGYLYLGDRMTDMILTGGSNIYPAEVEAAIQEHPLVHSCAVIGLPDEDLGSRVHAIVEADDQHLDIDELLDFLGARLVRYKVPRSVEVVDHPLRDDAGKVRRSAAARCRADRWRVVSTEPWWKTAVVYQIYPRSFADSNGDGIGDLPGITSRLDYLADLGVDVLWLSPVYRSPQDDNGYDISDYRDIDPVFGTLDDFDDLLDGLHRRGMKLMMDLVVNHTSDEHPWFVESRSSRDDPRRDWYWWRPPRPGFEPGRPGAEPTNWRSFFSGPTWQFDERTGEYYLHLFSRKQPDLNWENPEVREAIHEMMRWWLDRGVDGFRMDVINAISKDLALPDGLPGDGVRGDALLGDGRPHVLNGPRLHEFLREMHREVLAGRPGPPLTVAEMPEITVADALELTDPANAEVDMVFQFEHMQVDHGADKFDVLPLDLRDLKASLGRWQEGLADPGWNSLYWDNHDQPRVVSRFGDDGAYREQSAKMLATVLHLHRGTPYVYQGEELAMTNAPLHQLDDFRDLEALNHYAEAVAAGGDPAAVLDAVRPMSRDNARTPMQWDGSLHAGFTTGTPWIDVNPNHVEINAAAAVADPDSVYHHYRRLIALRHDEPAVALGDFTMLLPDHPTLYAFTRRLGLTELLVLGNFSAEAVVVDLPDVEAWYRSEVLIATGDPTDGTDDALTVGAWGSRVLRREI